MFPPTPKYRRTAVDPIDGVPMSWTAHPDGLPIRRGDAPDHIDRHDRARATHTLYARSEVLEIPKDLKRYTDIIDWIANARGVLRFEERTPAGDGKWAVWVTWFDVRGVIPAVPGMQGAR